MTPERVSQREFARLDGCSEKLVRLAVRDGRLTRDAAGKLDASLAGTAWRVGNVGRAPAADPLRTVPTVGADETPVQAAKRIAEAAGQVPAYADSLAKKEHYLALLRQLEYMQRSGAVVELAVAQSVLFDEARARRLAQLAGQVRGIRCRGPGIAR